MEATSAGLTTGTLGAFTVVHGAAAHIAFTGSTANLTSGATRVLTATIAGRRRQHRHLRQLHRGRLRQGRRAPAPSPAPATRPPRAASPPRPSPARSPAPSPWKPPPPASPPARSTFTVVHGAADRHRPHRRRRPNLTSGATRVLTATVQDAAGNTVTSDNSTVVAFAKASGAGTVTGTGNATAAAGVATKTVTGALDRLGHDGSHRRRPHHRHARRLHGRPRRRSRHRPHRLDRQPHLRRHPRPDRRRSRTPPATPSPPTTPPWSPSPRPPGPAPSPALGTDTATQRRRHQDRSPAPLAGSVTMEATAAGLTTGTLGAFTVVHGAAAHITLHRRRPPTSPPARTRVLTADGPGRRR